MKLVIVILFVMLVALAIGAVHITGRQYVIGAVLVGFAVILVPIAVTAFQIFVRNRSG